MTEALVAVTVIGADRPGIVEGSPGGLYELADRLEVDVSLQSTAAGAL